MFDILLFDLDGTLTDPKEGITKCAQHGLKACGITVDNLDDLERFIGPPLIDSFTEFYGLSEEKAQFAVKKYRERFADTGIFENRLFDGVHGLLKRLKSGGKTIALATSKPEAFAKRILEHFDIGGYFDVVCGSEFDGTRVKKAEVIKEAVKRLGNPDAKRIVMIGDREHDILGAKECGIKSIGLKLGYARPGELECAGADFIADDFGELEILLTGGNGAAPYDGVTRLLTDMVSYNAGDPKRIQHALKVTGFARVIGESEGLSDDEMLILLSAAALHDIAIRYCEREYSDTSGKLQEREGPRIARPFLDKAGYLQNQIERILYLIAHHHTYSGIDGQDYQILVEADFLVNLYEDCADISSVKTAYERIFKTKTGRKICRDMFGL